MPWIEDGIDLEKQQLDTGKKTVFLIGDSIRIGYCGTVQQELSDIANVVYPSENCRYTQHVMTNLQNWVKLCDPEDVAVVQFNCGHWDVAHWQGDEESLNSIETYAANIARIAKKLRKYFPNARIVFATTTGMNPAGCKSANYRTTSEIMEYNQAALSACSDEILINDLFAITAQYGPELFADYCHLTPEGFQALGKKVAAFLRDLL